MKNTNHTVSVIIPFYNSEEYKPIKQIRLDNADSNGMIIEGV